MSRLLIALPLMVALASCGGTNPITGQKNPFLIYGKGKCNLTGQGSGGVGMASEINGFSITQDFGDGCYLYFGPPPAGFNPPAIVLPPAQ